MDLRDYVRVIRQRWILILVCVLVTTGAAAVVTSRGTTPSYVSEVRLFIAQVDDSRKTAYESGLLSIQRMSTYVDLATGDDVAGRVVDDLNLDVTAESLSGRITANVVPSSVILSITAQDADPELAQQIAASAAEQLIGIIDELETPPGQSDAPIKTTVTDAASLPVSSAAPPQHVRNIGLGLMLGLMIGLGLAVMRELLDNPVSATGDDGEPS